jgi:hypothetical protein
MGNENKNIEQINEYARSKQELYEKNMRKFPKGAIMSKEDADEIKELLIKLVNDSKKKKEKNE